MIAAQRDAVLHQLEAKLHQITQDNNVHEKLLQQLIMSGNIIPTASGDTNLTGELSYRHKVSHLILVLQT